ncbi:YCF48-related protein [Gelidibacter mesophilus]|uniref:YCF48-related protein n=1 Tax=Gelidibacter mesophilus TaxID=169050 RepID=UPI000428794F|nr:YCF48-related protein [Gelidibacter mesophilus]
MKYYYTLLFCFLFSVAQGQTFIKDFFSITELVSLGTDSYFVATDERGFELWKTDGTKANTFLIKDINTLQSSDPAELTVFNGEVYFSANDGFFGRELWKTDGTEQGTRMVKNSHQALGGSSNPSNFTVFNNELYFTATDHFLGGGYQLWKTDGTENGTVKLHDAEGSTMSHLVAVHNKLYFTLSGSMLMSYDPQNGFKEYPSDVYYSTNRLMAVDNALFYTTYNSYDSAIRLYKLEADENPILLHEFSGDQKLLNMTKVGSSVYFSIAKRVENGQNTDDLWKTNGTQDGTILVKTFTWDPHLFGSNITNFIDYKDDLFFRAGNALDHKLWKSDGTTEGTVKVGNTRLDPWANLVVFEDLLYYIGGQKIWANSGSTESEAKISNVPIVYHGSDGYFTMKAAGGELYFKAAYQERTALYTISSNPILEVKKQTHLINVKDDLYFESKLDSVAKVLLDLKNIGNKELVFSKVEVVGRDFYINDAIASSEFQNGQDRLNQKMNPGETSELEILFYPSTKGVKHASLYFYSTDVNFPLFEIALTGFSEPEIGLSDGQSIQLKKMIDFTNSEATILLDSSSIPENAGNNYLVGKLKVKDNVDGIAFQLPVDPEYPDNAYFKIKGNLLKTKESFDFEQKNTYQISISGVNNTTNLELIQQFAISVLDVIEAPVLEACGVEEVNMGYGLNAVTFLDATTVVAVGSHGAILKSDDAGMTWRRINSKDHKHLINLQFVNATIGYAIGDGLFKTEDGGETWFKIKLTNAAYPPRNLYFVNEMVGYLFGENGTIYSTTDGGRYWKQKNVGYNNHQSAHFFNADKGIVVGSSKFIYTTLDGGTTWESKELQVSGLSTFERFTKVFFINDTVGFIGTGSGKIIQTLDSGKTWKVVSKLEYATDIIDLKFFNDHIGYVLTEGSLFKTNDSGKTWVEERLEDYHRGLQSIALSPDGTKKIMVGHGASCCVGLTPGHIIYAQEAQNPWTTVSYLALGFDPTGSIYMKDNLGLVFGSYEGARSFDGGVTWERITAPGQDVKNVSVVEKTIYISTQDGLFKSIDYGSNWTILNASSFKTLFYVNERIVYATAHEGVFKSEDSGHSWTHLSSVPENGWNLFFKNENEGYVGTVVNGLYKTTDGGLTWMPVPLEIIGDAYMSVYAVNLKDDIGFAGTSQGLFKTIDGGVTWKQTSKTLPEIRFILPVTTSEWFTVSQDMIFRTVNAGDHWELVSHGDDLSAVYFANEKLFAIGYKTFIQLRGKQSLAPASPIAGPVYVRERTTEQYQVNNDLDANYVWTVTGPHKISYSGNTASVEWTVPGTYKITVQSYDNCASGSVREMTVTVAKQESMVSINGATEVEEFSNNHGYSTAIHADIRYHWLAAGHQNFTVSNDKMKLDWGKSGLGKVQLIATNANTGLRQEAHLDVAILAKPLPSNNFKVEVIGESCPGSNNGKINITASVGKAYQVSLNGVKHQFTTALSLQDLPPKSYEFCIVEAETSYKQCYKVELPAAAPILGRTSVQSESLRVDMENGTAPFKIFINGTLNLETSDPSFSVQVKHGDIIAVHSDIACEGVLHRTITIDNEFSIFPNPSQGDFQMRVPVQQKTISISMYSAQLRLISNCEYPVTDGNVQLSLKDQSSGLYLITVHTETPVVIKLLKQ